MRTTLPLACLLALGLLALPGLAADDDKLKPTNLTALNTDGDEDEPVWADNGLTLYFGVKKNGAFVDPTKLAPKRGRPVPSGELGSFRAEAARLYGVMAGTAVAPAKA